MEHLYPKSTVVKRNQWEVVPMFQSEERQSGLVETEVYKASALTGVGVVLGPFEADGADRFTFFA